MVCNIYHAYCAVNLYEVNMVLDLACISSKTASILLIEDNPADAPM